MARRPSYIAKLDEDAYVSFPPGLQSHRPSVGQPLAVDWSRGSLSGRTYTPLDPKYESTEVLNYNDDDKSYVELSIAQTSHRPMEVNPYKLPRHRRSWERLLIIVLAGLLLFTLFFRKAGSDFLEKTKVKVRAPNNPLRSSVPLHSFRANLKDGRGYVTTFPRSGLTNQVMEFLKLVHLAQRLDRAAIFPELKAVRGEGSDVPLSQFFDLEPFQYYTNVSTVEWRDVKIPDIPGTKNERLSCWGWRDERPLARYNIHTDFWPPPGQLTVPGEFETSMTFPAIEVLVSQPQDEWLTDTAKRFYGSVENSPPFPDHQLLCFENLFFVPSLHFVEGEVDHSYSLEELAPEDPVWDKVGRHLHFSKRANEIADELITSLLGNTHRKFVAVHIRQGDFVELGRVPKAIVESYSEAEQFIQDEIVARKKRGFIQLGKVSRRRLPVLFATDSTDPAFIKELTSLGWIFINHSDFATTTRFGGWYPALLDSLILSRGNGFVGTKQSTFSYLTARRVESWQGGVSTIVG